MAHRMRRHVVALWAFLLVGAVWVTSPSMAGAAVSPVIPPPLSSIHVELGPFSANGTANNDLAFTSVTDTQNSNEYDFNGQTGSGISGGTVTIQIMSRGNFQPGVYESGPSVSIAIFGTGEAGVPNCDGQTGTVDIDQSSAMPDGTPISMAFRFVVDCLNPQTQTSQPYYQGTVAYNVRPSTVGAGYYVYEGNGRVTGFGNDSYLNYLGDLSATKLNEPIVGMATVPNGGGYWMVASDGGIFNYGDAAYDGSLGSAGHTDIVGITH